MKKKNLNLEYYVFNLTYDNKLYRANILKSDELKERIYNGVKSGKIKTFEELRHKIRMHFMKYWSRIQFEYMVSGVFQNMKTVMKRENRDYSVAKKMDVFFQIENNLNMITEYVIHRMELPIEIPKAYPDDPDFWDRSDVVDENINF